MRKKKKNEKKKKKNLPEQESGQDAEAKAIADAKTKSLENMIINCMCGIN